MIVAMGQSLDGRPLLILGLSDENWRRMRRQNEPLLRDDLNLMGVPLKLVLMGGRDEGAIEAQLSEWFDIDKGERT